MNWLIKLITIKGLFRSLTAMCNNAAHYATISENIRETRNSLLLLSGVSVVDVTKYQADIKAADDIKKELIDLCINRDELKEETDKERKAKFAAIDRKREIQMECDQIALVIKEREQLLDKLNTEIEEKTIEANKAEWAGISKDMLNEDVGERKRVKKPSPLIRKKSKEVSIVIAGGEDTSVLNTIAKRLNEIRE